MNKHFIRWFSYTSYFFNCCSVLLQSVFFWAFLTIFNIAITVPIKLNSWKIETNISIKHSKTPHSPTFTKYSIEQTNNPYPDIGHLPRILNPQFHELLHFDWICIPLCRIHHVTGTDYLLFEHEKSAKYYRWLMHSSIVYFPSWWHLSKTSNTRTFESSVNEYNSQHIVALLFNRQFSNINLNNVINKRNAHHQ